MINEAFGWAWITLGFLTGFLLGTRFHDEKFLGGYGSWARRLLRLGHVACIALGALNILFALSAARVGLSPGWLRGVSWAFVVGGITMPVCCVLAAWRRELCPLFIVPVAALVFAAGGTALGMVLR